MCARVYLNGDGMGKGTHMSLFFVIMKGDYDALLPWPFRQKVSLTLLDVTSSRKHMTDTFRPDPTSTSFRQPLSDMNIASGCPLFVAQSVLETPTYIKDDTLYIKVTVDVSDLSPPYWRPETFASVSGAQQCCMLLQHCCSSLDGFELSFEVARISGR